MSVSVRLHACWVSVMFIFFKRPVLRGSLSGVGGVVCRGVCAYVRLGQCVCVRQRQGGVAVGRQAGGHQVIVCNIAYRQRDTAVTKQKYY